MCWTEHTGDTKYPHIVTCSVISVCSNHNLRQSNNVIRQLQENDAIKLSFYFNFCNLSNQSLFKKEGKKCKNTCHHDNPLFHMYATMLKLRNNRNMKLFIQHTDTRFLRSELRDKHEFFKHFTWRDDILQHAATNYAFECGVTCT